MILQGALQWIGMCIATITALRLLRAGGGFQSKSGGMLHELRWLLEETPALNAFLLFAVNTVLSAFAACSLYHISNSSILSLDIIFFLSAIMLILYHTRKEATVLQQ